MRVSLFKKGRFAVVQILTAFGWACFATHQFFVTLYYQQYMRYTPIQATIRFLPMSITGLILNFIVAVVASFAPAQLLIAIGALGTSLAPLLFAVMPTNVVYWQFEFPAMILTVLGADFIFAVGCMYGSKIASKDEQGLAGGVFNVSRVMLRAASRANISCCSDCNSDWHSHRSRHQHHHPSQGHSSRDESTRWCIRRE